MRASRLAPVVAVLCLIVAFLTERSPAALAAGGAQTVRVQYQSPVAGTVADPFRAPDHPYGPGNRGLEILTAAGAPVTAAADGRVSFAGPVGGQLHVSIDHADGTRTTVSYLAKISARAGQTVQRGDPIGVSGGSVHFGARRDGAYLDPMTLLQGGGRLGVVLVATQSRRQESGAAKAKSGWRRAVGALGNGARRTVGAVGQGARTGGKVLARTGKAVVKKGAKVLKSPVRAVKVGWRTLAALPGWFFKNCTPAGVAAPRVSNRRLAILVPGLSSDLGGGFSRDFDARGLGYDPHDIDVFSYRGGAQPFGPAETSGDLHAFGASLRAFIAERARRAPGVPVDIIAHSQGGVIARVALTEGTNALPPIAHLITLDSPHNGVPAASLTSGLDGTVLGRLALMALDGVRSGPDLRARSLGQLAEGSSFLSELNSRPLPAGVSVTSIAARGDVVVPAPSAHLDGATNVIVAVPGLVGDHSSVVNAPDTRRAIALALADKHPSCDSFLSHVLDHAIGEAILEVERAGVEVVIEYVDAADGPVGRIVSPVLDQVLPMGSDR